ncbi:MAG: arginine repressor [Lachnospiraceae bacterium]|nr:arginine repressor [Lachnospiraceae bacterium]
MKNKRQETILHIIETQRIETQEELAEALQKEGFAVTQATISRDIHALRLKKSAADGERSHYVALEEVYGPAQGYGSVLTDSLVRVDHAMNLLVLKTRPGMAMAVAAAVDAMDFSEIVGTIAGDDTIMCAVRSVEQAKALKKRFLLFLEKEKE